MAEVVRASVDHALCKRSSIAGRVPDHLALLKPRVMSLVVFTGGVGMAVAPGHISPAHAIAALICMAAGAGGCGALNMWYDADIDGIMQRTAGRPIPTNRVQAREALITGILLSVMSVLTLGLAVNWAAAAFLGLTIAIYVPFYTMFLKRRTVQNIVLGGAAGALPPVIGWAAVTGDAGWGALSLFLIIFLWTPPHFWALAICRSSDYERAGIPMLPTVVGPEKTARQISIYSAALAAASFLPPALGIGGIVYTVLAAVLGVVFLVKAFAVQREHETERRNKAAYKLFGFSIFYMAALFVALLATAF
jgi:heme o synthase